MASPKECHSFVPTVLLLLTIILTFASANFEGRCEPEPPVIAVPVFYTDALMLHFALNLEHLECEYFLFGALCRGLDFISPDLAYGGPPPIGGRKANLDPLVEHIVLEFGYQEVGHLRAIERTVGGIGRPLLDISPHNFAMIMNMAFGCELTPPFDPYNNSVNYMLGSYIIPYMGLVAYVGAMPNTNGFVSKNLTAGLLAVEAGQDAVIREWLFERSEERVWPYNHTIAEFADRISMLRNRLAGCGIKDEGLIVPPWLGAEQKIETNVLSANNDSLGYSRTPKEVLRVVYGTGDEHRPGGFYPEGGRGEIALHYLEGPPPSP